MGTLNAGDLAIVVRCDEEPKNIGIICEVQRYVGTYVDWEVKVDNAWECKSHGRAFVEGVRSNDVALIADFALRPVSGLKDEDTTDTEQPIREIAC